MTDVHTHKHTHLYTYCTVPHNGMSPARQIKVNITELKWAIWQHSMCNWVSEIMKHKFVDKEIGSALLATYTSRFSLTELRNMARLTSIPPNHCRSIYVCLGAVVAQQLRCWVTDQKVRQVLMSPRLPLLDHWARPSALSTSTPNRCGKTYR